MDFKSKIPERIVVRHDKVKDVWYVVDMWHSSLQDIADLNIDVPDDSPAVKLITALEMNAVIAELRNEGFLDTFVKTEKLASSNSSVVASRITKEDVALKAIESIKQVALEFSDGENLVNVIGQSKRQKQQEN